jgi:hypothetical protein
MTKSIEGNNMIFTATKYRAYYLVPEMGAWGIWYGNDRISSAPTLDEAKAVVDDWMEAR